MEQTKKEQSFGLYPQRFDILGILDKRANPKNGKIEYLVQWKMWPNDPTWEPKRGIKEYLDQNELFVGDDDLKKHYKEKQYRRRVLREERNDQVEKIYNETQRIDSGSEEDSVAQIETNVSSLEKKYAQANSQILNDEDEQIVVDEELFEESVDDSQEKDNIFYSGSDRNKKNGNQKPTMKQEQTAQKCKQEIDDLVYEIFDRSTTANSTKQEYSHHQYYNNQMSSWTDNSVNFFNNHNQSLIQKTHFDSDFFSEIIGHDLFDNAPMMEQKMNSSLFQNSQMPRIVKKYPPTKNEEVMSMLEGTGNFIKDTIESIEYEVKYSFKVNWNQRKNGIIPESKHVQILKKSNISPQEMIDLMIQANCRQK